MTVGELITALWSIPVTAEVLVFESLVDKPPNWVPVDRIVNLQGKEVYLYTK